MINSPIKIVYSKRKTVSFRLTEEGTIKVQAPSYLTEEQVLKVVEKNAAKINRWLEERRQFRSIFYGGDTAYYWGSVYRVCEGTLRSVPEVTVDEEKHLLWVHSDGQLSLTTVLLNFYKEETEAFLKADLLRYAAAVGVEPKRIRVKNQKTRWGSCSSKQNLNFNLRLAMVPREVATYIVVHELCHLVHMNHSAEFWSLVEHHVPNWKSHRHWLKKHAGVLI